MHSDITRPERRRNQKEAKMTIRLEIPQHKLSVQTSGGHLGEVARGTSATLDRVDVVLVLGVQFALNSGHTSGICGLELLERSAGTGGLLGSGSLLLIQVLSNGPFISALHESTGEVVVTGTNEGILVDEHKVTEGKLTQLQHHGLSTVGVHNCDSGVMAAESQEVTRGRPLDGMNPSIGRIFGKQLAERKTVSIGGISGLLVHTTNEGGHNSSEVVCGGSGEEDVVGMPVNLQHGGLVSLQVLADPPIIVLLEVADGDQLGTRGDGELVLIGAPLDISGGAVDAKNYKSGLPGSILVSPHIGISVLTTSDNSVALRGPVDSSDELVVFFKNLFLDKIISLLGVDDNGGVVGAHGKFREVSVPSVTGDLLVELVDLAWCKNSCACGR